MKNKRKSFNVMSKSMMASVILASSIVPAMVVDVKTVQASEYTAIKDMPKGSVISFAGRDWILLDPSRGYIFMEDELLKRAFHNAGEYDSGKSIQIFNPEDSDNIAYYLNKTYYNSFTNDEKAAIQSSTWVIGRSHHNDLSGRVDANIGLLSESDWNQYSINNGGFLPNPDSYMWLLTRNPDDLAKVQHVNINGVVVKNLTVYNVGVSVHPALTLKTDTIVSSEGTIIIDTTSPTITLTEQSGLGSTSTVTANIFDESGVKVKKWAKGTYNTNNFPTGTVFTGNTFSVPENGVYSVYAEDNSGNKSVETISVTRVNTTPSTPTLFNVKSNMEHEDVERIAWNASTDIDGNLSGYELDVQINGGAWTTLATTTNSYYDYTVPKNVTALKFRVRAKDSLNAYSDYKESNEVAVTAQQYHWYKYNNQINSSYTLDHRLINSEKVYSIIDYTAMNISFGLNYLGHPVATLGQGHMSGISAVDSQLGNVTYQVYDERFNNPNWNYINQSQGNKYRRYTVKRGSIEEYGVIYKNHILIEEIELIKRDLTSHQKGSFHSIVQGDSSAFVIGARNPDGYWYERHERVESIDTEGPDIYFENIIEGELKTEIFNPNISVVDINGSSYTMTLNGEEYTGGMITESGPYTLVVNAVDGLGNTSTKSISFEINAPPVKQDVDDVVMKKSEVKTFDFSELFVDPERDEFTLTANSSDSTIVNTEVSDGVVTIEAMKQGSAIITLQADDGSSLSEELTIYVNVETRPPKLSIVNEKWILVDEDGQINISGTVIDEDKEKVTISSSLNEIPASMVIDETTGNDDTWELSWEGADLPTGVYDSLEIQAMDEFGGSTKQTFTKPIVKVGGNEQKYMAIVELYSNDVGSEANNWNIETHTELLEAYEAINLLKNTNTQESQNIADSKVNALADGSVKERFQTQVINSTFDWLIRNFDKATVTDYTRANIPGVTEDTLGHMNELGQNYILDKPELVPGDVILLALIAELHNDAAEADEIDIWLEVETFTSSLDDGDVKSSLMIDVEKGIFRALDKQPSLLTENLLNDYFGISTKPEYIPAYATYLGDKANVKEEIINREDLGEVINAVDMTYDKLTDLFTTINSETLQAFITHVESLTDGDYKEQQREKYENLRLLNFVTNPLDQKEEDFTKLGIDINPEYLTDYLTNINKYVQEKGAESITIPDIQNIVDVTDAMKEYLENPSDENLQKVLDELDKLDADTELVRDLKEDLKEAILEVINNNPGDLTTEKMDELGIEGVDPDKENTYQDALKEYADTKSPLSAEDIQKVVDAVNSVENAKENPSTDSIKDAYEAVDKLEEGSLKEQLLDELEKIAVDYIANNPNEITLDDLNHADINNVNPELLDEYREYLTDIVPTLSPVTKNDIQDVVNSVNYINTLYQETLMNPTRTNVELLDRAINNLEEGLLKTRYKDKFPGIGLVHLIKYPTELQSDSLTWAELAFLENNLETYQLYIPAYIEEVGKATMDKTKFQSVINWLDTYIEVIANPSDETIDQFLAVSENIDRTTDIFNELYKKAIQSLLDKLNENMGNVTEKELEQIGIEDVEAELLPEYQDALEDYKNDLAPETVTVEDIQDVIDAINRITEAEKELTPDKIKDALDAIEKLEDGSLKDELLERLENAVVEYINQNPELVTEEMLDILGIESVDESIMDKYQEHLKDYLPLSKDNIQQVIDVTNLYQSALLHVTDEVIQLFKESVDGLVESSLKTKLSTVANLLNKLLAYEKSAAEVTEDELHSALDGANTYDKAYLNLMVESLVASFTTALAPSEEAIDETIQTINILDEGQFKTRLLTKVGEAYLEYVQNNPDNVTADDLIKAGFERIKEDNIEEYQEGLTSVTEEHGLLEREVIQHIIDIVNGFKTDEVVQNLNNANDFKETIEQLIDSEWKTEQLEQINKIINKLTPRPSPGPSPSPKPDEDEEKEEEIEEELPSDWITVEGDETSNGYDFTVNPELMDEVLEGNQSIIANGKDINIKIPNGSIDFEALQEELGKYGLLIQLIKMDVQNYKLIVKAVTPDNETELLNFEKHLSVSIEEGSTVITANNSSEAVVLRKEGNQLLAVPHHFANGSFIIKTMRPGQFVLLKQKTAFTDIKNTFSKNEIEQLANRNIVFGTDNGKYFNPGKSVTRAELAAMMARSMDLHSLKEKTFTDVKGRWYEDPVMAVYEAGIVLGKNDSIFAPDQPVTRQEAAVMMARALKYADENSVKISADAALQYKDKDSIGNWAKDDVLILQTLDIMAGKSDGTFNPGNLLTRGEMAKILNLTLKEIDFM